MSYRMLPLVFWSILQLENCAVVCHAVMANPEPEITALTDKLHVRIVEKQHVFCDAEADLTGFSWLKADLLQVFQLPFGPNHTAMHILDIQLYRLFDRKIAAILNDDAGSELSTLPQDSAV